MQAGAARGLPVGSASGETQTPDKHVVVGVDSAEDVGSTPTASTILDTKHLRKCLVCSYNAANKIGRKVA